MGLRGPAPTPTAIRKTNGNPSRRPFPLHEPNYGASLPLPPKTLSKAGRRVWDDLVTRMAAGGVLCGVDYLALAMLCQRQAMYDRLDAEMAAMMRDLEFAAKDRGRPLSGGAMVTLSRSTEGRRIFNTMNELASWLQPAYREFGITPASRSRVEATGAGAGMVDPLESAIAG